MLTKIGKFFINKYFLTLLAFAIWLIFFDSNNLLNRMKVRDKLNDLKNEKQFYLNQITHDSLLTVKLLTDSVALEKFAREKYLMKRDHEDVYLILDSTEDLRP